MKRSRAIPSAVTWVAIGTVLAVFNQRSAHAQGAPPPGAEPQANAQELAKKLVNPLTDLVSVPLQFNWINGIGLEKETRSLIYFQPVVPMSLSEDWNLIGRWVMPYVSQPMAFGGSSGLGLVYQIGWNDGLFLTTATWTPR